MQGVFVAFLLILFGAAPIFADPHLGPNPRGALSHSAYQKNVQPKYQYVDQFLSGWERTFRVGVFSKTLTVPAEYIAVIRPIMAYRDQMAHYEELGILSTSDGLFLDFLDEQCAWLHANVDHLNSVRASKIQAKAEELKGRIGEVTSRILRYLSAKEKMLKSWEHDGLNSSETNLKNALINFAKVVDINVQEMDLTKDHTNYGKHTVSLALQALKQENQLRIAFPFERYVALSSMDVSPSMSPALKGTHFLRQHLAKLENPSREAVNAAKALDTLMRSVPKEAKGDAAAQQICRGLPQITPSLAIYIEKCSAEDEATRRDLNRTLTSLRALAR
ncbi:MAG: hypothetical protein HYR96_11440 [Deltaproteobacteria bacterium]|nr:hypothetical protein [Deltaproteobacteria bacterium]MBI3293257.1 hypothetical protein [Deltaproteobacteria bacterium]